MAEALAFPRPIPWGVGAGRAYLPSVPDALAALDRRLVVDGISREEAQSLRALQRMLATARGDPGTLDFEVVAAAFARFVAAWHKRNFASA